MTLDEFREKTKDWRGDTELTVEKNDKGQVCGNATVPVVSVARGFDWLAGQAVITPAVDLVTDPGVVDAATHERMVEYAERLTRYIKAAAHISAIVGCMADCEDKQKLSDAIHRFIES